MVRPSRFNVVAGSFVALIFSMPAVSLQTLSVFAGPVSSALGWKPTVFYLGVTLGVFGAAAIAPFNGLLADRIGVRKLLLPGIAAYGLALMAMALATPSAPLYIVLSLAVFTLGQLQTYQLYARAVLGWSDTSRGLTLSIVMTGTAVGNLLMPMLAETLIKHVGWRGAYVSLGLIELVAALPLVALTVFEAPRPPRESAPGGVDPSGLTLAQASRTKDYWLLLAFTFVSNLALFAVITHLVPILQSRGLARQSAIFALSGLAVTQFVGRLCSGWLLDLVNSPRISLIWFVLSTLGVGLLAVAHQPQFALGATLLIGFAWGAEAEMNSFFVSRYFGLRHFTQINGTVYTSIAIAGALGPLISALFQGWQHSYSGLILCAAGMMALSCALLAMLSPYVFLPQRSALPEIKIQTSNGDVHAVST